MTIQELLQKKDGTFSCEELTKACLKAIAENDQAGKKLNAVSEIDPDALFYARAIDEEIRTSGRKSVMHGIPVLVKDNIDVKNLHNTAGSLALQDLIPSKDAPVVRKLREAGALILGKTNLSEFAYFMSMGDMPSGYSSLRGQVVNAHNPSYDCSGSSSGSAVAVSAGFVPCALGTETDGSLMSPAAANSIVSLKPTVGLVSRTGIIPISGFQDTAGPMAVCTEDIAAMLSVIAGKDGDDPATYACRTGDYLAALSSDCRGLRAGILINEKDERSGSVLDRAESILKEAGASVCRIEMETVELDELVPMTYEFRQGIDRYLASHQSACRNLEDIVSFNRAHADRCLVYGQDLLEKALATSGRMNEAEYLERRLFLEDESRRLLNEAMEKYGIDVIVSAGENPVGNLAPVSGYPCMSLPALSTDDAHYRPINYYMISGPWCEDILIRTAYTLEKALNVSCAPCME
ncbi:MAG: hypothetical protein K6D03_07070 [Solobacterium sp.]|nr:hypothetical protein [Solobacterium sp.]